MWLTLLANFIGQQSAAPQLPQYGLPQQQQTDTGTIIGAVAGVVVIGALIYWVVKD